MKKILFIFTFALVCCKPMANVGSKDVQKELLLSYSKGPCLGRCPVYHLKIFTDGTAIYKNLSRGNQGKEIITKIADDILADLQKTVTPRVLTSEDSKIIRDKAVTRLKINNREYRYHASQIRGELRTIDLKLSDLAKQIRQSAP